MIGIAKVERLADEVIRRSRQLHALTARVGEPAAEIGALRDQQGEVEQPAVAVGRPRAGLLDQPQELGRASTERRLAAFLAQDAQPDRAR